MPSTCPPKYRPDEYFGGLPLPDSRLCTGLSSTDPAGTGLPLQLATRHLSFCFRLHLEAGPQLKPALEFHQQFLPLERFANIVAFARLPTPLLYLSPRRSLLNFIHHGILTGDLPDNRRTLAAKSFETQSHPDTC